ncbi:MAG: hypothetical protein NVSMB25_04420 [Thermoleophilaceae bacterium]
MPRPHVSTLVVAALALAGCGGTGRTPTPAPASGAAIFRSSCTGCHRIAGVGSRVPSGGELDHYHLTKAQIAGLTRVMPTPRKLSEPEVQAVSAYVAAIEARR